MKRPDNLRLKSMTVIILLTLGVFSACGKGTEPVDPDPAIAITNCTLIDGTGAEPIPNATLVISKGLIATVGPASLTTIPPKARIIDVEGATVLPGFINAHVHNGFSRANLQAWAQAGVTTVRDLGGPTSFAWKNEISKDPHCARLIAAGPMVSVPGGYPLIPWGSPYMLSVTSVSDAQTKVAGLLVAGADIIKLAIESGESFQLSIPTLSRQEAIAIVNTAHQYGTIATVHVLVASDLARALETDVDDIAHMVTDSLPDSLVNVMVNDSVFWVPTLELWHHVNHSLRDAAIANLRKFVTARGQVALGTDYDGYSAQFQMGMPTHEMDLMMQAGMSSMQAIVAGTRNAAQACNRLANLGTIESGKVADLLVIDGNPLEDIHNLDNVRLVIRSGVIIRDEGS